MQNILLSGLGNTDMNDSISILAYISQIRSHFLRQHELETLCLDLYHSLNTTESTKNLGTIVTCLVNVEKQNYLILNNYTIYIGNKYFFKLVLLATLRHFKEVFNKRNATITVQEKHQILQAAMLTFRADKIESLLLLRLIDNIIKKNKGLLEYDLALKLLLFSETVAISPFEGHKSYAHNISKIALLMLESKFIKNLLDLNLLPITGVETIELVPYYKQVAHDRLFVSKLVTKVIQMFSNNIENREGGFLYRSVLFEDFSYWKEVIWPQFFVKFQLTDFEGEFIQSLIKYWIPQCVSVYKLEFYTFICTIPISDHLKGHLLLETRRKGLIGNYNNDMLQLLSSLFADNSTSLLALKIVSSYFKSNIYPCDIELQLVNRFLYGQREALNSEQLKCLHIFWSQIGVVASELYNLDVRSAVQEHWLVKYKKYVMDLFTFYLKLLQTSNKKMAAQILRLFWKLTNDESPYLLNYKLDKKCLGFYSHIFLYKEVYIRLIEKALLESNGNFLELSKLGQLILPGTRLYEDNYLLKFIDECTELNSIMATESVKNVSSIVVFQNKPDENVTLLRNLFDAVNKHFQHFSSNLKSVFKGVLLFEAILEVSINVHVLEGCCAFMGFDTYCLPVISDILHNDIVEQYYKQEVKKGNLDSADHQYRLLCKIQKIVESLLNNMLRYILQDDNIWHFLDKPKAMDLLVKIIETSNMRRPTTLSADVLKHVAKLIDQEYQEDHTNVGVEIIKKRNEESSYKIRLLHNTLQKLSAVASVQNLTIRRNPESRLIIHALCQSDGHPQKPLLTQTLLYLLQLLSDPRSTDSTVSSAMHCTEILISDNTLYNHTLTFVPNVTVQCVEHFKNRNWIVRNANIQLARSLIDRFLGVLIGQNNRPKSVEDLFRLFPQLTTCFCHTLIQTPLTDSAIIVMQIFSESQIKRRPLQSDDLAITRNIFLRLFMMVIKENANHYGLFAVRAYTSLCFEEQIPDIIRDVVDFILANSTYITAKHTIRNFVQLLHELYDKFLGYTDDSPVKPREFYAIQASFDKLSTFLKHFNSKQFDLLLFKTLSTVDVTTRFETSNFDVSDYSQRVWLHNYVPSLVINCDADLREILTQILSKNIMSFLEVKILSILVDRYSKNRYSSDVLEKIVNVLMQKMLVTDDTRNYLLLCYFKVVFLFLTCDKTIQIDESCLKNARSCYETVSNIHKMFVVILILAKVPSINDYDKKFIRTAVQRFKNLNLTNFQTALMLSDMLPYIYKNVCCICDKYRVFKIAAFLIVEHGLYNFVSVVTKSRISSPLFAMIKIFDYQVLVRNLDNDEIAFKFVKEFYESDVLNYCTDDSKINRTYYVEEKTIYVDRLIINKIVLKFLRDFGVKHGNLEWFRHYKLLQSQSKG